MPPLDDETLGRLRSLVKSLHAGNGPTLPAEDVIRLAGEVRFEGGVTVDFRAAGELGEPLVVVRLPAAAEPASCIQNLSPREREVAALIANGLSNKQIAGRLFLALGTIKDHVHRILDKTRLANRAAIAAAFRGHAPDE